MKWSRLFYCAAIAALTTFLITRGTSPWFTIPLAGFAAWWTYLCTHALWTVVSFRIEVWRGHQIASLSIDEIKAGQPHKAERWESLANPKLDSSINTATLVVVLVFPALLWLPLIFGCWDRTPWGHYKQVWARTAPTAR
jgi:hypothetical protein